LVKQALKQWAKIHYVNPTSEKNSSRNKLDEFQKSIEGQDITPQIHQKEFNLQCQYQQFMKKEEEEWHLKSWSLWL
jgi:hypothetical protein